MGPVSPAAYLILPLMGVAASLALHNLWMWLERRNEPLHLWVGAWCANSLLAYCKKVRNDSNYWQTIEAYIGERSAATFSHGICPDCREKIVQPELERWRRERDNDR
ncbi:MAG: hypothetical protein HYV93_00085 [Candidatus Rokubacteria bacterium]|nr:hypothetical protein [Candidatus Rokubacteria bacterium]